MVAQGVLPYQLAEENQKTCLTGLAGLPVYLDLAHVVGLRDSILKHVQVRTGTQGWTDAPLRGWQSYSEPEPTSRVAVIFGAGHHFDGERTPD